MLRVSAPRARASRRSVRFRGSLGVAGLAALTFGLAGCGTGGSSTSTVAAVGTTLGVYLSDPPAVQSEAASQDVVLGEELAFAEKKGSAGVALSETIGTQSASDNARAAIHLNALIAYMGEVQSGQSVQTVGITNAQDVLEFSPSDGVKPTDDDFESLSSYGRTFASLPLQLTTSDAALNAADPGFSSAFQAAFRHRPSAQAITGYDAVWLLTRVLSAAHSTVDNRGEISASVIATLEANRGRAAVGNFRIVLK